MRPALRPLAAALALSLGGCSFDLSLPPEPPPPGPGTVQGRAVYAIPGQAAPVAAAGARATILGTSLGAVADDAGRFVVTGVLDGSGALLVQVDLDHDGKPDKQTLLQLASVKAGMGRDVALGDVVVVENARLRGRVLRGDVPGTSGHGGSLVFVPSGPYLTYTGDDGSFVLDAMPAGRIDLTFFRDGYTPEALSGVELRAGEDFTAREISLEPVPPPAGGGGPLPGALTGHLVFSPDASGLAATVTATPLAGAALTSGVSGAGAFSMPAVPPGLYRVEAALAGYATAVVPNVLVGAAQEVQLGITLSKGGLTVTPPEPGAPPTCVAGARCDLPDTCQVGAVACVSGAPFCGSIGNAIDGIPCAANHVCQAGRCEPVCVAGASCQEAAEPCMEGVTACSAGLASCAPTAQPRPDGAGCGLDQVCRGGACLACRANRACTPANACHAGLTSCATGVETCVDTAAPLADGASCGTELACQAGVCGACTPSVACSAPDLPCAAGVTSCATGRPLCVSTGAPLANGSPCGAGQVCFSGACQPCAAGSACTPGGSACQAGVTSCELGYAVCAGPVTSASPGTSCGADLVCSDGGSCVSCQAGQACLLPNPCHAGAIACGSGAPVCQDTAVSLSDGTGCGADLVCHGGACVTCVAGASCVPANPCHAGATSCATGLSTCQDSAVALANGASCGSDAVCRDGSCGACVLGAACDGATGHAPPPGATTPCQRMATLCATGLPACGVTGDQPDGTACPDLSGGSSYVCRAGACTMPGYALRVLTAPAALRALPNQSLSVTLQVTTVGGAPVLAAQAVTVTAPAGAQAPVAAATSTVDGTVSFTLTLGRAPGPQHFTATTPAAFAPLDLVVTADAPPDGTVIPVVNAAHLGAATPATGPAPKAALSGPQELAVAQDGTLYVADTVNCVVKRITPAGVISVVAGTGTCGAGGDGGPATGSALNLPKGIALDELSTPSRLIIADTFNHRVRAVDLGTGRISLLAGTGTAGFAGDGASALSAQLNTPVKVAIGPERPVPNVYVADGLNNRFRIIDGTLGTISTWPLGATAGGGVLNHLWAGEYWTNPYQNTHGGDPYHSGTGSLVFDSKGNAFISAYFYGGEFGGSYTVDGGVAAVVRRAPDGTLTRVAGAGAAFADGLSARGSSFYRDPPAIALDHAVVAGGGVRENLYLGLFNENVVARVDGASLRLEYVMGTTVLGGAGDFGPARAATVNHPVALAFAPGTRDLYLVEEGIHSVRLFSGAGATSASTASLAAVTATSQSGWISQRAQAASGVALADGAGAPLATYPVEFSLDPTALPGGWLAAAQVTTTGTGVAAVPATRAGLAPGLYRFLAGYLDLHGDHVAGSPVAFTLTAAAPAAGTVVTAVNESRAAGLAGVPGPGAEAQVGAVAGIAAGPGGTAWFSDSTNGRVHRIAPSGLVSTPFGTGTSPQWGSSGDGPVTGAFLWSPRGLGFDPGGGAAGSLYVVDDLYPNAVVNGAITGYSGSLRRIDLATNLISTVWYPVPWTATSFYVRRPLASGGRVWVGTDYYTTYPVGAVVTGDPLAPASWTTFLTRGWTNTLTGAATATSCPASAPYTQSPLNFAGCGGVYDVNTDRRAVPACNLAMGPEGLVYVAGYFCGGGLGPKTPAVVRVEADGSLTRITGGGGSTIYAGLPAAQGYLGSVPSIAFTPAGDLVMDGPGYLTVTGTVSAGTWTPGVYVTVQPIGTAPAMNEYLVLPGAHLGAAGDVAPDADGHVWIGDGNSVRLAW